MEIIFHFFRKFYRNRLISYIICIRICFRKNNIFEIFFIRVPPYIKLNKKNQLKNVDFQCNNGLPLEILSSMHILTFIFGKSCIRFHTHKHTKITTILQINVIGRNDQIMYRFIATFLLKYYSPFTVTQQKQQKKKSTTK